MACATNDLSVITQARTLRSRYERLLLISHRRHVPRAMTAGAGTLIYTTDWLTWRLCLDAGLEAVHFEGLLEDGFPAEEGNPTDAHRRAWEWVYVDGLDVTLFEGVSLGKLFVRNIGWVCLAFDRQRYALDRACARWSPNELVFTDLRAELDLIGEDAIRKMVVDVAGKRGIRVVEQPDRPPAGDPGLHDRAHGYGIPLPEPILRRLLRQAYCEILDAVCRLRDLVGRRHRRVFVLSNWSTVRGLVDGMDPSDPVRPALVTAHLPKRPAMLWSWIRSGITMLGHPPVFLTRRERSAVELIGERLTAAWSSGAEGVDAILRDFVTTHIIRSGWLGKEALEVKRWRRLFQRHRPERLLIGDATNSTCRLVAEVAHTQGVPVDELLNGMFLTAQRYDARTGDGRCPPAVDRLLAWGLQNEHWLEATEAPLTSVKTGYPALDALRRPRPAHGARNRALVLPLYADADDVQGLWSNIFMHLVATVSGLARIGCREIRVKVHPGPFNASYYAAVLAHFGLVVELIDRGSLEPHIHWADFIVGPVNSGAFVEALACGKSYFPMRCTPSLIEDRLLGPVKCYTGAEDVIEAIGRGETPDVTEAGEYLASLRSIPNAGRRVWSVLGAAPAVHDAVCQAKAAE